jgi:hypothetical protein
MICSANSGKSNANNGTHSQTYYKDTINDISIGESVKGPKGGS